MIVAPPSYAPSRSPHVYTRELGREFPPPTWELQPPDPNWQGRRYMSPEGDAWLAFYASPADGEPISAHLKAVAFADGEEITALQASQDQLIVSGVKGDQAFYRKARLACEGRLAQTMRDGVIDKRPWYEPSEASPLAKSINANNVKDHFESLTVPARAGVGKAKGSPRV